jgi:hypothetical protein
MPLEATLALDGSANLTSDSKSYLTQVKQRLHNVLQLARRTEIEYRHADHDSDIDPTMPGYNSTCNFNVNDTVMAYTPGQVSSAGSKFTQDWTGPFTVTSIHGKVLNLRRDSDGKDVFAHCRNVKLVSVRPSTTHPPVSSSDTSRCDSVTAGAIQTPQQVQQQVRQVRQVQQDQQVPHRGHDEPSGPITSHERDGRGEPDTGPYYYVDSILQERAGPGKRPEYLVRWVGWRTPGSPKPTSSEAARNSRRAIRKFLKQKPKTGKRK